MYPSIQLIAYEIVTTAFRQQQKYLGSHKAEKDIRKRTTLLKQAIDTAHRSPETRHSRRILKLFVAPEFFFRSAEGAYPVEQVSMIMEEMAPFIQDPRFSDWLFVHGTALGYFEREGADEIFNMALVQKGGRPEAGETSGLRDCIIYREYLSQDDFITEAPWEEQDAMKARLRGQEARRVLPTYGSRQGDVTYRVMEQARMIERMEASGRLQSMDSHLEMKRSSVPPHPRARERYRNRDAALRITSSPRPPHDPSSEVNRSGIGGGCIFTIDGVTFGLETGVDHHNFRLAGYLPKPEDPEIRVQIVLTSGKLLILGDPTDPNSPSAIVSRQKILVCNVDGQEPHSRCLERLNKTFFPLSFEAPIPVRLSGMAAAATTQGKYFPDSGSIRVYSAVQIPKPTPP